MNFSSLDKKLKLQVLNENKYFNFSESECIGSTKTSADDNGDDYITKLINDSYNSTAALRQEKKQNTLFAANNAYDSAELPTQNSIQSLIRCSLRNNNTYIPGYEIGFRRYIESKKPIACQQQIDTRAVVSLALLHQYNDILGSYANKLPILTINVSRFMYTVEAFNFRNQTQQNTINQQALNFYIQQDIKFCERFIEYPANQRFSIFLHLLRSNGYREYYFNLARQTNLNIDYIVTQHTVIRYIRTDDSLESNSIGFGFLTVLRDGIKWFVKTTKDPIVTDNFDLNRYKRPPPQTTSTSNTTNRLTIKRQFPFKQCLDIELDKRQRYNDAVNSSKRELIDLERYVQLMKHNESKNITTK